MAALAAGLFCSTAPAADMLAWADLPPLPEAISGQAAGAHHGAMIVAGGSSFAVSAWQGGAKQWKDRVYVLLPGGAAWRDAGRLPGPRAYAGAVSDASGVWLFGGTDGQTCFDDVLRLEWKNGALLVDASTPRMPAPMAYGAAALLGRTVYVIPGQSTPNPASPALDAVWTLDLSQPSLEWKTLPVWPGPARILPVCVAQAGSLYLFSGCQPGVKPDGSPDRKYLTDGYRYSPGTGWSVVAGPPRPLVAAPASEYGAAHIFAFSGDDGTNFARTAELGDQHPGFPKGVLAYHTITDTWTAAGDVPEAYVTTQALLWQGGIVIPGGEDRPGHRGTRVLSAKPAKRASTLTFLDYAAIAAYFAVLVSIGIYFSRREKNTEAFFLGGRNVPWWAVGLSIFATSLSAITYLSVPARAYAVDCTWMLANTGIFLITPLVIVFYIPHFRGRPISTAYEYLERRFNLATRLYGSVCFIVFQGGRVGIVLLLPAIALSAATGMNIYWCIALMGLLTTIYTALGGIEAVIWTDVLQTIVLLAGAVFALFLIVGSIDGGATAMFATANAAGKLHTINWSWDYTQDALWVVIIGNAFSNLYPATADQTAVQRYLATSTSRQAGRALWIHAFLAIPVAFLFFGLGIALWVFFRQHPQLLDPALKNDAILPLFIAERFPAGMRGLLIAGVFAASMSTLDSSINSVSSVLIKDFYQRFSRHVPERRALRAAQLLTLVLGVCGTCSALYAARLDAVSLWEPFLKLLNLVGGGLAGIFALGVFTRRANGTGAITGAVVSGVVLYFVQQTRMHFFLHAMVAFSTAFAVGFLVSLLVPSPRRPESSI